MERRKLEGIKKVVVGGLIGIVLGTGSLIGGCADMTPQERQALGILGGLAGIAGKTPQEQAAGILLRDEATRIDEQQARLKEAERGKSEINIYGNKRIGKDHEYVLMMLNKKESKWEIVATDYNSIINLFKCISDTSEKGVYPILIGVKNRNSKDYDDLSRMNLHIEENNITIKDMNNEPLYIRPIKK